jgi:multidrug efflux pump subunit AcrA (membrane-fusion protein)
MTMHNVFRGATAQIALIVCLIPTIVAGVESNGVVTLIDSVNVPAETAGVLLELSAKEGSQVSRGQALARVDSSKAEMLRRIASLEFEIQQQTAANDVKIRATASQAEVAAAEYEESVAINERVSQAIPQLKVRRLMLSADHARLEVEVAQIESEIDRLGEQLKQAELEASDQELGRCELHAPLSGVIVERYKHVGEWVTPGESVLRIVRMDQLRIEWLVKVADVPPHLVEGRDVIADVNLANGQTQQVLGKVSFVSPMVEPTDEYRVWCEFDNPMDAEGHWLLRAGLEATVRFADATAEPASAENGN